MNEIRCQVNTKIHDMMCLEFSNKFTQQDINKKCLVNVFSHTRICTTECGDFLYFIVNINICYDIFILGSSFFFTLTIYCIPFET